MLACAKPLSVIPAKAGIHLPTSCQGTAVRRWVPAFAGMTLMVILALLFFSTPAFAQAAPAGPADNGGALGRAMGQTHPPCLQTPAVECSMPVDLNMHMHFSSR